MIFTLRSLRNFSSQSDGSNAIVSNSASSKRSYTSEWQASWRKLLRAACSSLKSLVSGE